MGALTKVEGINQMMKPPRVERVEALPGMRLRIAWSTGECFVVDLTEPITSLSVLAALREPAFFTKFSRNLVLAYSTVTTVSKNRSSPSTRRNRSLVTGS